MSVRLQNCNCIRAARKCIVSNPQRHVVNPQFFRSFSNTPNCNASPIDSKASSASRKASPALVAKKQPSSKNETQITPPSVTKRLAQEVRKAAPSFTETYVAYGVCESLVKECARVADYNIPQASDTAAEIPRNEKGEDVGIGDSWWYQKLELTPTFNTWAQITFLHMYLLTVRMRCFPPEHAPTWHQHLTDHFFHLAEDRMVTLHRMNSRMMRNKYLKDLFVQWRGLTLAYDEGLMKGDAVLAAAVWRNVCKGDENIDVRRLAEIVSYIRSVLSSFDAMDDEVIAKGEIAFSDPSAEGGLVKMKSKLMDPLATDSKIQKAPAKPLPSMTAAAAKD